MNVKSVFFSSLITASLALPLPVKGQTESDAFPSQPAPSSILNLSVSDLVFYSSGNAGSITWEGGMTADQVLTLGSFSESLLPRLSMGNILETVGKDPDLFSLGDLPFMGELSLAQLVDAFPALKLATLADVPVIQDLLAQIPSLLSINSLLGSTIGDLVTSNLDIASVSLNSLPNLFGVSLVEIPGLLESPLGNIPQWQSILVEQIPGLSDLPFSEFLFIPTHIPIAILDVPYGDKEAYRLDTISGGYNTGFNVPCHQTNCSHIELGQPYLGKQWISGDSQQVSGGSVCLVGMEPTGRHPFGKGFKVVAENINEGAGTVDFSMYFRLCLPCSPLITGCTPYNIGPVLLFIAKEKDLIFIGQ